MMRSNKITGLFLLAATVALLWPRTSPAIPAFARKYGFTCAMCHTTFPRLNDFGVRFRANGYEIPGRESEETTIITGPPPFAAHVAGGYTNDSYVGAPLMTDTRQFQLNGIDILAGGVFESGFGFFMVYTPEITDSTGVEGQTGNLEAASVVFTKPGATAISLRAGRFEPAYVVFSNKRQLTASPYEIYNFGAPGNLTFDDNQEGVEVSGLLPGFSYAAGLVNGSDTNLGDDPPSDTYVRLAGVLGPGEGQSAGQRFGVSGYYGRARPGFVVPAMTRQNIYRLGADLSLNLSVVNLAVQYLYGKDDENLWGTKKDQAFSGGFAELSVTPADDLVALARYDWVNAPGDTDIVRWTAGVRYYFFDNFALHLEYSQRHQEQPGEDMWENFFTARADYAF